MKLYFFYAPSKYRAHHKKEGIIAFELKAFYTQRAYSNKAGKEITTFSYVDQVECLVNTRKPGHYRFMMDHGKDGAQGHYAKSFRELKEALQEDGYFPVNEKAYFRFRKLASRLMHRHTNFGISWTGRNDCFYSNDTDSSFYHLRLLTTNFHHNRRQNDHSFRKWMLSKNIATANTEVVEEVRIFMARNSKREESSFDSYKFSIDSSRNGLLKNRYTTLDEAMGMAFGSDRFSEITTKQYERLRKIVKYLIFEHEELDLSALRKKQDYFIRILDA